MSRIKFHMIDSSESIFHVLLETNATEFKTLPPSPSVDMKADFFSNFFHISLCFYNNNNLFLFEYLFFLSRLWSHHYGYPTIYSMTRLVIMSTLKDGLGRTCGGLEVVVPHSILLFLRNIILVCFVLAHHGWSFRIFKFFANCCLYNRLVMDHWVTFF